MSSSTKHVLFLSVSVTIVTVGAEPPAPTLHPSMRSAERAESILNNVALLASVGELQLPGDHSAPRPRPPQRPSPGPALRPRLSPSPAPPSESVSVTQRRCEAEGPSGGAAAASTSSTRRAARSDLRRALRERTTKRPAACPSARGTSALGLAANFPSPGLAGWLARKKEAAKRRAVCSRSQRTHTAPPRSGSRSCAGLAATTNCPVSGLGAPRRGG